MKISFITTIKNESLTILSLLISLEQQSYKPEEVIIVDAGSTDNTTGLIKQFQAHSSLRIKLLNKIGNRASGRNYAIKNALGQGIAISDAGCVLDKHWLKLITQPLCHQKADVVAGFYHMTADSLFTQCSALFVGTISHNLNKKYFLPSSRSLAFTKNAWETIGGYPQHLDYAEDLIFAQKLKDNKTIKVIFEPRAWVQWTPPRNLIELFTAIKNYTSGNIQAHYWRHLYKNLLVVIRYTLFAVLLFTLPIIFVASLIPIYFLYTSIKFRNLLHHPLAPNLLFVLQVTADIAVIMAMLQSIYDSLVQTLPRSKRN